jgi:hypothetical protein
MTNNDKILAIADAARIDLDNLVDPVGLQRAALESVRDGAYDESVVDGRDELELDNARHVARKCRDAVTLRETIEALDP